MFELVQHNKKNLCVNMYYNLNPLIFESVHQQSPPLENLVSNGGVYLLKSSLPGATTEETNSGKHYVTSNQHHQGISLQQFSNFVDKYNKDI